MFVNIILIILGFILLIKGADVLVEGSSEIAKKLGIPELVVGLTIVSIGTSMPELFVSVTSAINGHSDMALGNVIGSNLCNFLLILGLSAVIKPVKFNKESKFIDIPICIALTIIYLIFCNLNNDISRFESIMFIILFFVFLAYIIIYAITDKKTTNNSQKIKITPNLIKIVVGIISLKYGGDFVVDNAELIAKGLNISEKVISLTIVAIGTSLPELVTSITASIKGSPDIAMGNILGSNIFNFLLITGLAGAINPITYNPTYNIELVILLISTIVLGIFPYTDNKDEMTRSNGITYLMLFTLYVIILFIK